MREGWEYRKLGEVAKISSGKSIPSSDIKETYSNGLYPCYGGNGLRGYVDHYSYDGFYPIIGRVGALCGNVHLSQGKFYATEHALVVSLKTNEKASYLEYILKHLNLRQYAKGVAQPVLSASTLSEIPIPVPPLSEQERIVSELDLLQSIIEKKKAQLKEYDQLAQSIFYDMFGDILNSNPIHFLNDIASYYIGLTYKPTDVSEDGTIVLRSSNIQNNLLDFEDIVRVNMEIKDNKYVQDGDILMCARNGSARLVGKVAKIKNLSEKMSYGAFMTIIRSEYNEYLFHFFLSDYFRNQLLTSKTATINQITSRMLDNIKLNIPSLSLQQQFAAKIESIERQKELIKQSITEVQTLFDSRMDYWFT